MATTPVSDRVSFIDIHRNFEPLALVLLKAHQLSFSQKEENFMWTNAKVILASTLFISKLWRRMNTFWSQDVDNSRGNKYIFRDKLCQWIVFFFSSFIWKFKERMFRQNDKNWSTFNDKYKEKFVRTTTALAMNLS